MKTKTVSNEDVVELVKELKKYFDGVGGLTHIYLVACGGSHANMEPLCYLINSESKTIHCENINGQEFADATPINCNKNSLVIGLSLLGGTRETVAGLKKAKECGAKVVTVGGVEKCKIAEQSEYHFVSTFEMIELGHVAVLLRIGFEILKQFENYTKYNDAIKAFSIVEDLTKKAKKKASKLGKKWGAQYKDEPVVYTLGSGNLYTIAYMNSICLFMEMQWVNTNSIHSGELFHGPFEITQEHTPFLMFESIGRTRPLDERALKFLNKYSKDVFVLDAKDFEVEKMGKVAEFMQPILMNEVGLSFMEEYMNARNHPMFLRKYMMKEEY